MIPFKLRGSKKKHEVPTVWQEVTYSQWEQLQKTEDHTEIIAILSGFPVESVVRMDERSKFNIVQAISFIYQKLEADKYEAPKYLTIRVKNKDVKIPLIENIKKETWGQKIYLDSIVKKNQDNIIDSMVDVILTYAQPIIDNSKLEPERFDDLRGCFKDVNLVDLYSTARSYILQLNKIVEIENVKLHNPPTTDQIQAGINEFDQYGVMNTVKALAGGDVLKYEEVFEIEYNIVFTHMAMNTTQAKFQDNYREILKRK